MTVSELVKKRKGEQVVGVIALALSLVFFSFGYAIYFSTGLLGPLILYLTECIIMIILSAIEIIIVQQINLFIYLKEHEK
jgi:hypothetical protein